MGSTFSSDTTGERETLNQMSEGEAMNQNHVEDMEESDTTEEFHDTINDNEERSNEREAEMEEFRKQLKVKREQRKEILLRHRNDKMELEKTLEMERTAKLGAYETNKQLRELLTQNNIEIPDNLQSSKETSEFREAINQMQEEFDLLKSDNNKLRKHLADSNVRLQGAYSDMADLSAQNTESIKQINALKEVIAVSKTMMNLREQQLNELKNKLNEIERSLADREASMLSADLRQEYERQLQNIRTLRGLYEERARLAEVTRQSLVRELEEQRTLKEVETNKCRDLTAKVEDLEAKVENLQEELGNKNCQIAYSKDETCSVKAEMNVVNKLFSQVLLGYKTKQDLDKLVHRLEENHGILTHMAENENDLEASTALPKLLLELVSQVDDAKEKSSENNDETSKDELSTSEKISETRSSPVTTAEEIVQNLPKVWRVLMELLSHQSTPEENPTEKVTTCYKSVETKSGPVLVPSVSQTYIRLKDLIVEKLALVKEVSNMKQLNSHLESRLEEQEKRLCLVTTELSKTWHVVGRLRRHHHQLHTHEKILKYELQQKRKLLNELKEELEYCREKWEQAREKNSQTEKDLKKLRTEFSNRKTKSTVQLNNSAESGYSDERPTDESSESNDESEYVTEQVIRSKKEVKKSLETILDSSNDLNLAAEREDPASDMLDVADLPLDTQEGDEDDNHESCVSESIHSECLLKSERVNDDTEDELADLGNDSCVEELSIAEPCECEANLCNCDSVSARDEVALPTTSVVNIPVIDPAAILESIRLQNERLAKKEIKLTNLEKNSEALLKKTQITSEISIQIDRTLDDLINKPSTSRNVNLKTVEIEIANDPSERFENTTSINEPVENITKEVDNTATEENLEAQSQEDGQSSETDDFEKNLETIKKQDKQLTEKDERLENLETACSNVLHNITDTLKPVEEVNEKLETLHKKYNAESSEYDKQVTSDATEIVLKNNENCSKEGSEPSTSSELDHEARFAARDLRLKRLEEQTKSLVTKVNKTTTKGVKINYKLEELHNIYGSENSRAGTPSQDNEEPGSSSE